MFMLPFPFFESIEDIDKSNSKLLSATSICFFSIAAEKEIPPCCAVSLKSHNPGFIGIFAFFNASALSQLPSFCSSSPEKVPIRTKFVIFSMLASGFTVLAKVLFMAIYATFSESFKSSTCLHPKNWNITKEIRINAFNIFFILFFIITSPSIS